MRNIKGNSRSSRGKGFSKRRDNNYGGSEMHQATCDNCGKQCTVPFKPTSGKPIYCSSCFDKSSNDRPRKLDRARDDRNYGSRDSRKKSYGDRDSVMHKVVCDSCGKDCEVPFKPTKGKPIYCDNCFENNKENNSDQFKKEFEILNKKLDRILKILEPEFLDENYQEEFEKENVEPEPRMLVRKRMVLKNRKK